MRALDLSLVAVMLVAACKDDKPAPATPSATPSTATPPPVQPAAVDDRCQRGVGHVQQLMAAESKAHDMVPSADEQRAIGAVGKGMVSLCQSEGLSQEQLDCLLNAKDWDLFKSVGDCPAIRARRPSWLRV